MNAPAAPALALHNVSKQFGKVRALDGASFALRARTVHALLGENGAGKTTLMRVAYGLVKPDTATIERDGVPAAIAKPSDAIAAGIGMVHQHFSLVPEMTVAENLSLGRRGPWSQRSAAAHVRSAYDRFGVRLDPDARVSALSVAQQQRVEVAKALLSDASVLILDEPTAVLAPSEAQELLTQLRALADGGTAVVLITHKLRDALSIADDVTVLRSGKTVYTSPREATSTDVLVEAMLGTRPAQAGAGREHHAAGGDDVLALHDVSVVREDGVVALAGATLSVKRGEIVGLAGVEGSGQRELLRVLAGRATPAAGQITRPDTVGFVPEDRHRDAVVLDFDLAENVALAGAGRRRGSMSWPLFRAAASSIIDQFHVSASHTAATMRSLSGGNQQRFVVGRELQDGLGAIVVENPTRGLDIRAAEQVLGALRSAAAAGAAVVMYSSDIDELLATCDRILVCFGGRVREVPAEPDAIGHAMVGART